jgi:hypothetical protein
MKILYILYVALPYTSDEQELKWQFIYNSAWHYYKSDKRHVYYILQNTNEN